MKPEDNAYGGNNKFSAWNRPLWDGDHAQASPFLVYDLRKKQLSGQLAAEGKTQQQVQNAISNLQPPAGWRGMPTTGTVKVPVFLVDFPDAPHDPLQTPSDVGSKMFGDGDIGDYPYESLANYYKRSSYNKLNITGDVLGWYRAAHPRTYYASLPDAQGRDAIISELFQYYDTEVDFSQYDSDRNGKIDAYYVVYSGGIAYGSMWWAYEVGGSPDIVVDGVNPDHFVWGWYTGEWEYGPPDIYFDVWAYIHETGHLLGLPDIYDGSPDTGPKGGVGGWDMMDTCWGDHNAFSKYLLGWIDPVIVNSGDQAIDLPPSETTPDQNAVLIMPGATRNSFSEFFMVQYREPGRGNDPAYHGPYGQTPYFNNSLWIWHVDATLDGSDYDFANNNYYTDHKLIRLMEGDGREQIEAYTSSFDYFDFYTPNRFFGPATIPNSTNYAGGVTNVGIYNLSKIPGGMRANFSLTGIPSGTLSLGGALDCEVLPWSTDSSNHQWNWYGENSTTSPGLSAARSGQISNYEVSALNTTVLGPGNLSFSWKTSSEPGDRLTFYLDNSMQSNISGEHDWGRLEYPIIPGGFHQLSWIYAKDGIDDGGDDSGWVDDVEWSGPVMANFSATPLSGVEPLMVHFTDLSTGVPTNWNWSFGDGNFSFEQNPNYTYLHAGNYTVSLTSGNQVGNTTKTNSGYIYVTNTTKASKIGVFRQSAHTFYQDYNGNGAWNGGLTDRSYNFGITGDIPVTGDWNRDGISDIGVFRPSTHMFYLDFNGNGVWNGGATDRAYNFGITGDIPVTGDWNRDGISDIGVFRPSNHMFYLDFSGNGVWNGAVTDRSFNFGITSDIPVTGDWNNDGITEIGVFRSSTHMFYLDYNGNGAWNGAVTDRSYNFGLTGDIPVTGDWNLDGITEIGVFRPSTHMFYLDYNGNGAWNGAITDRSYNFGLTGDRPVAGKWS